MGEENSMNKKVLGKLKEAEEFCNKNGKSMEFTIQYMQDYACVGHGTIMKYFRLKQQFPVK